VILSSALTVAPHFFSQYNGTIAAALFFPMTFTSYAVMLIGRFIIRLTFYVTLKSKLVKRNNGSGRKLTMVAFHRPFRRLAKVRCYLCTYIFVTIITGSRSHIAFTTYPLTEWRYSIRMFITSLCTLLV
jgi:hypothetical protein